MHDTRDHTLRLRGSLHIFATDKVLSSRGVLVGHLRLTSRDGARGVRAQPADERALRDEF